jgi:hypothetical protein
MGFDYSWITWTWGFLLAGLVVLFIVFPIIPITILKVLFSIVKGIAFVLGKIIGAILSLFGRKKSKGLASRNENGRKNKSRSFD